MTRNPPAPHVSAKSAAGRDPLLHGFLLVLAGFAVYWPALHGMWLWDDQYLLVYNADMRTLGGLERIWFARTQLDYWPLTSTLLWIEVHLFGNHPLLYHLTTLAFHLWSGVLVWQLFARLGLRLAWLGGLLFIIHPLAVESVAWVSEIKNTFSLALGLLALHAWLDFDTDQQGSDYRRALLLYILAMLAKTSVIMLPAIFLLHTWWKHNRVTVVDLKRTAPFFLVAIVLGLVTKSTQNNYALADSVILNQTVFTHLACAGVAMCFYLWKFLVPVNLLPIYPRWAIEPPSAPQLATIPLLLLMLAGLWWKRRTWGRHVLLGLGFFLLNLLPVCGLVTMSYMNITWVADHLAYLPMIGLIGLVIAGLQKIYSRVAVSAQPVLTGGIAALCLFLAWRSHAYAENFVNEVALWTYAVQREPDSAEVQSLLANAELHAGQIPDALLHAEAALKLQPDAPKSYAALGDVLSATPGRAEDAATAYQSALDREPNFPRARVALGRTLAHLGRTEEAITQYHEALAEDPKDAQAHTAIADALAPDPQRRDEAVAEYRAAIQLVPDDAAIHLDLADVLATMPGRIDDAVVEYQKAEALQPYLADIHNEYGHVLLQMPGRLPDAIRELETALRIRPGFPAAHYYLAVALSQTPGRAAEAIPHLQAVLQANPDFVPAQQLLARLQAGN